MKVDLYTRFILTLIAICLVAIALRMYGTLGVKIEGKVRVSEEPRLGYL